MSAGQCAECGKANAYLMPLHDDKGGPLMCLLCAGAWHAEHGRARRAGYVVIKAIKAYFAAGGRYADIEKLRLCASGVPMPGYIDADTLGADVADITSELLADTVQLTHPDRHPPEFRDLAQRVTQELLALKPFVFPRPPQVPPPAPPPRDVSSNSQVGTLTDALRRLASFPCTDCWNSIPYDYCSSCRAEWESRQAKEREARNAKQRANYLRRKQSRRCPPVHCAGCDGLIQSKRKDAKHCSAACRQRAHRQRVTPKQPPGADNAKSRYGGDA